MELNKIYHQDCYEGLKSIPDKSVDLIITDPPYDIPGIHGAGIMASRKAGSFMKDIEKTDLHVGLDMSILDDFVRVSKKINCYIWCNRKMLLPLIKYFVEEHGCNYEIIIWAKDSPIPFCGTHYLVDKEYCLYFWEEGAPIHIPFERAQTVYFTKKNIQDKSDYGHPTIKDLEITKNMVLNSSQENDVVLDTFMGSGTTAVACKQTGRQFIGFEINDEYYKIACDRLIGINQKGEMNLFETDFDKVYEQMNLFEKGEE